jgi:hypothetical protein
LSSVSFLGALLEAEVGEVDREEDMILVCKL